jgi:hypothetical protein
MRGSQYPCRFDDTSYNRHSSLRLTVSSGRLLAPSMVWQTTLQRDSDFVQSMAQMRPDHLSTPCTARSLQEVSKCA